VYAYDYFAEPPEESKKSEHGPDLYRQVTERLAPWEAKVHGGDIRTTAHTLPDRIAFCQIDLNDAEAEGFVFPLVYERVSPGGIVIFDDYGFARYCESAVTHQKFLKGKEQILEMPTGQGLLIKA
jgi:O-methyltransferase